ncbi:hypothetical protein [Bacteroides reticulotermitis]|uniref:hypothetical protein n=1 Tax=Bacteroides reticulotermitis TaxID=1133319 RepID=UPI003A8BA1F8
MKKNKIIHIIINLLFCLSLILIIYLLNYNYRLIEQIKSRDILISVIQKKDSLNNISDTILSVWEGGKSALVNDEHISIKELLHYSNDLYKKVSVLEDSLSFYRMYYKMTNSFYGGEFKGEKDGNKIRYQYLGKNVNKMDSVLKSNLERMASIENEKIKLSAKLAMYQKAIDKYHIRFDNYKEYSDYIEYQIRSEQIDSALMLLPYFRNRLTYNAKKGYWEIETKGGLIQPKRK